MSNLSTEHATKAAVYRDAARLLETFAPSGYGHQGSPYCCDRIGQASGWFTSYASPSSLTLFDSLRRGFTELFSPTESCGPGSIFYGEDCDDNRNARILALCFMAAMVEAGDA